MENEERDPIVAVRTLRTGTYVMAFVITAFIFAGAFLTSYYFNGLRVSDVRAAQDDISIDILSLETQFDLLQEHSCSDVAENTILTGALSSLGDRLSYMEAHGTGSSEEVVRLKRLYSLLEIKDYLLMKQVVAKCNLKPIFILYFYSNEGDCADCEKQGYALTALARDYPQLRIYSFDRNLDVSALKTLISINDVDAVQLPALVTNGKVYEGYHNVEDIQKLVPQLKTLPKAASSTSMMKRK